MIVELVRFPLPSPGGRNQALALYRQSAPGWRDNPDLLEKFYVHDPATGLGGGLYLWPDAACAERWHGLDYQERSLRLYGAVPECRVLDVLMRVRPSQRLIEEM